jgi:hypothetical protein
MKLSAFHATLIIFTQTSCLDKSKSKGMLEVSFDAQGLILYELIPEGHALKKSSISSVALGMQ